MNIKSIRNVLATTTLSAMLVLSTTAPAALAQEVNSTPEQALTQEAEVTVSSEVLLPKAESVTYVQKLPLAGTVNNIGEYSNFNDLTSAIINENIKNTKSFSFTYKGDMTNYVNDFRDAYDSALKSAGNDYVYGTIKSWKYSIS